MPFDSGNFDPRDRAPYIPAVTKAKFYDIATANGDVVAEALAQKDGLFVHHMLADDGESFTTTNLSCRRFPAATEKRAAIGSDLWKQRSAT
jgi:hypothetical protein